MVDKLQKGQENKLVRTDLIKCADFSFCQWRHVRQIQPTNYIIKTAFLNAFLNFLSRYA